MKGIKNRVDAASILKSNVNILTCTIFPGGSLKWKAFLARELNTNVPETNNAPAGEYKVSVLFNIDTAGRVIDVKPVTNCGYGMEAELMRALKASPNWNLELLNGKKIKSEQRTQMVTYIVP